MVVSNLSMFCLNKVSYTGDRGLERQETDRNKHSYVVVIFRPTQNLHLRNSTHKVIQIVLNRLKR